MKIDFEVWTRAVAAARRFDPADLTDGDLAYWASAVFLASRCRVTGVRDHQVLLECANWDGAHDRCRAYETRPPVCRDFPWYGREPGDGNVTLELRCSYLLDVPPEGRPEGARPLIPLTVAGR